MSCFSLFKPNFSIRLNHTDDRVPASKCKKGPLFVEMKVFFKLFCFHYLLYDRIVYEKLLPYQNLVTNYPVLPRALPVRTYVCEAL